MKLTINKIAGVFEGISDKPVYILDNIETQGGRLIYFKEFGAFNSDVKTKLMGSK